MVPPPVPPEPTGPPAIPEHWPSGTRSVLMASMAEVVARRGYVETRVTDVIACAGGMSSRTFYRHFTDREDCFFAAYDTMRADALAELTPRPEPDVPPLQSLSEALARGLTHFAQWPSHAHVLLVEIIATGPQGAARHEATMSDMAQLIVDCEAWEPQKRSQLALVEQAQALIGAFHRVVAHRLADGRHASLPEIAPSLTALVAPAAA